MIFRILSNAMELDKFKEFIASIPDESKEDLTIYLNGSGGDVSVMFNYLDFFENYKGNITLVVTEKIISADFFLFVLSNTRKKVSPMANGYWHKAFIGEMSLSNNKEVVIHRYRAMETVDRLNGYFESKIYPLFTSEEIQVYESNEDVFLNAYRMQELAMKAEKLFFREKCKR